MWYGVNDKLAIRALWFAFLPSWFNRNYGMTFGKRYVFDPDYRVETLRFAARKVHERFSQLHIGSPQAEPGVVPPDFGNTITAAAAGCEVVYPDDNYPWNRHLPPEAVAKLKVPPDIAKVFPYNEIASQIKYLNRKFNQDVPPCFNSRGVLNDAVLIAGSDFLADFATETETAKACIDYSYSMLTMTASHNGRLVGQNGETMLTNCTIMMVSPEMYRDRLLDYDLNVHKLANSFGQRFSLHHCGVFDRYISTYRKIPAISFLEIGWDSDIRAALEAFPESRVQYIFSAAFLLNSDRKAIRRKTEEIREASKGHWDRFSLSVPDLDYGTPDESLFEIYECCKQGCV